MASLPLAVPPVILSFAPLFSKRVFEPARLLRVGTILAPGKRTVSAVLHVMGKGHASEFQTYHRVLNRARWSALQGSRILLCQLAQAVVSNDPGIQYEPSVGRVKGRQLMHEVGVTVQRAKRRGSLTTDSRHGYAVGPTFLAG
jgi:hypothetical protein